MRRKRIITDGYREKSSDRIIFMYFIEKVTAIGRVTAIGYRPAIGCDIYICQYIFYKDGQIANRS